MHARGAFHWPVELQIWSVLLLAHCAVFGAHTPVHVPDTHACFAQAVDGLHTPLDVHVCTPLSAHWTFPLEHTPQMPAPLQ
jgi:hypothetical protein